MFTLITLDHALPEYQEIFIQLQLGRYWGQEHLMLTLA
jgi:hypothetical protein